MDIKYGTPGCLGLFVFLLLTFLLTGALGGTIAAVLGGIAAIAIFLVSFFSTNRDAGATAASLWWRAGLFLTLFLALMFYFSSSDS
ncbi:MAG TPA: hypothetical protein VGR26_07995 [Acidimicrobiales bacterium]|nr:hypothetical protein [Acidimicrobiales bacterium]